MQSIRTGNMKSTIIGNTEYFYIEGEIHIGDLIVDDNCVFYATIDDADEIGNIVIKYEKIK